MGAPNIAEVEGRAYLMLLPSQPPHTHRCPDPASVIGRMTRKRHLRKSKDLVKDKTSPSQFAFSYKTLIYNTF
jgi:hypothetical protein